MDFGPPIDSLLIPYYVYKKTALLILSLFMMTNLTAQEKPVKIVFDVTSSNIKVHGAAVRHVKGMSKAYPDSKFEVVMYSGAIDMVLKDKSSVAADMEALSKNKNVSFVICFYHFLACNIL